MRTDQHVQRGRFRLILLTFAAGLLLAALLLEEPDPVERSAATTSLLIGAAFMGVFASCFGRLEGRDDGDRLLVRLGPMPSARKRIPDAGITGATKDRWLFVDGWGIHGVPGRGWIWNLWGRDCVRIDHGKRTVRVGADDPDEFVTFLREWIVGDHRRGSGASTGDAPTIAPAAGWRACHSRPCLPPVDWLAHLIASSPDRRKDMRTARLTRWFRVVSLVLLAPAVSAGTTEVPLLPDLPLSGQDLFGYGVAVSGDTAVVGARGDDESAFGAGAAYVFVRSGAAWVQQAKLLPADGFQGLTFGSSVAIDGDTIVVGAPEQGVNGAGSAYVYERSGTTWTQQAKLLPSVPGSTGSFGASVDIDGDTIVGGAPHPQNLIPLLGDAYVFVRSGTVWSEQARLLASDGVNGDWFGSSVSVSGDSVVVGASKDDDHGTDSGSAYVFVRSGTLWTQQAKLTASDGTGLDRLGAAAAIDGDTLAVGAWGDDDLGSGSGSAYVFTRAGTNWTLQAKLTASDGGAGDFFGGSLSLHEDTLVAGANIADTTVVDSGSAYVFTRHGALWTETVRLVAGDADSGSSYGYSVGIDAGTVVVGASLHDGAAVQSGAAYVYPALIGGSWTDLGFALAGIAGPPVLVGSGTLAAGQAAALDLSGAAPSASCALFVSLVSTPLPFKGGTLVPVPSILQLFLTTDGSGAVNLPFVWPLGIPAGTALFVQYAIVDTAAVAGVSLSNALQGLAQ